MSWYDQLFPFNTPPAFKKLQVLLGWRYTIYTSTEDSGKEEEGGDGESRTQPTRLLIWSKKHHQTIHRGRTEPTHSIILYPTFFPVFSCFVLESHLRQQDVLSRSLYMPEAMQRRPGAMVRG